MSEAKKHEPQTIKKAFVAAPEVTVKRTEIKATRLNESTLEDLREQLKRRRVPRRTVHSSVGILHNGIYQVAACHEIGEGGLLISSLAKLAEDDRVVVTLRIPGVLNGVLIGKVVYAMASETQEHARYGVMFDDVGFEVKRKIRNFVASATSYTLGGGS